jgi:hypothetical protein
MPLKTRNELRPVEFYDGQSQKPIIKQISGEDTTTSQAFWTSQQDITTASTPEQLVDKALNPGVIAVVKAKMANASEIHIGYDNTSSQWTNSKSITLINGQSEGFGVDNFNRLYINSSNSGDGVELYITTR